MCRAVRCQTCGRTTWAGCGNHVADVRAQVPTDQWCPGHAPDQPAAATRQPRWFRRRTSTRD